MKRHFGLQWHLSNECDQRCKHCYIWQKHELENLRTTPSVSQCRRIVDDFLSFCEEMDVHPYFSITGGDPLLYEHFWELTEILFKKKIAFTILGNPYCLNEKNAQMLSKLGCKSYQMSIDGLEKTHDYLRKDGSFKATLSALPILHKSGIRSMIMSTVSLLNYTEIPSVARLCVDNEVGNFAFSRYCPTHGDTEHNMPPLLYREFLAEMWKVYEELVEAGTNFSLKDHLWIPFLYEKGLYTLSETTDLILDGCNCGIKHMTLLPNGTVYACRRFDSIVGKIDRQSFKEIFFSKDMRKYREIWRLAGCNNCELLNYCRGCHAVSAGTTGSFFDKDPQCWRC